MGSRKITTGAAALLLVVANAGIVRMLGQSGSAGGRGSIAAVEASVSAQNIRTQDKFISDDLFEGRYPGLRGGELAARYIATQFALDGLKPAGDDGTYLQQVNFVGMKARPEDTNFSLVPEDEIGRAHV